MFEQFGPHELINEIKAIGQKVPLVLNSCDIPQHKSLDRFILS